MVNETSDRVDELLKKKTGITTNLEEIRENIKFVDKVVNNPVITDKFDGRKFNGDVININPYIEQQALPSSIYFVDKLIRLNTKASLEWMKRYLSKKRHVPMRMIWILLLLFGVGMAIVIIFLFIVPMMQGGGVM